MMTFGPEPDPPLLGFFLRVEALAAAAFRTIPVVGDDVARLFLDRVVPFCTPGASNPGRSTPSGFPTPSRRAAPASRSMTSRAANCSSGL